MAGVAGLEPVTSAVTGQRSNQLSYTPAWGKETLEKICPDVKFCGEKFFDPFGAGIKLKIDFPFKMEREPDFERRSVEVFKKENPGSRRQGGGGGEPR